ncbi:MAG: aldehyde dehydrogenase family protein [Planctomycetota bacterium]|nr:aldehyde dehydrogenase family protein [Planctomycetota bacterium]
MIESGENSKDTLAQARSAQKQWRQRNIADRLGFLTALRESLILNRDSIVQDLHEVTEKPRYELLATEIFPTLSLIQQLLRLSPQLSPLRAARSLWAKTKDPGYDRQPVGVVLVIASPHAPFLSLLKLVLPALTAGNAVLMQVNESQRQVAQLILKLVDESGFPAGILSSAVGDLDSAKDLVSTGINHVSFCGSPTDARKLASHCGSLLTSCQATLNTRGLALVLEGAPLLRAARSILTAAFTNHGLAPGALRLLYIDERVASQFESLLLAEIASIRQGLDRNFQVEMGPLASLKQLQDVTGLVAAARGQGLELITGGQGHGYDQEEKGAWFYQPTILKGMADGLEEKLLRIPGPVLVIKTIPKLDAAIERMNSHEDASLISVWGKSLKSARKVSRKLIHRRVALNDSGALVLSGQKNLGFDLHIDPLRIPLSLARSRPVHIKAWNQPVSPFCFPYDKEKYRAFSDLLGKLFSSNPIHRGQAFFGALTTLAAWSLED